MLAYLHTSQSLTLLVTMADTTVGVERSAMTPAIVALVHTHNLADFVAETIGQAGGRPVIVASLDAWVDALDRYFPVLALLDLDTSGNWRSALRRCKLRPHTRPIPICAFGRRLDADTRQAAHTAGADVVWSHRALGAELAARVKASVEPPVVYPDGWDDNLTPDALAGLRAFNRGEYYEQHEHLEHAWMAETRPIRALYQGVLQVGVAFYQIQQGNWAGSLKMFRRGLPRLRGLPPVCQGIDLAAFRAAAEAIHAEVTALGPERLAEFDQRRFPQIKFVEDGQS